MERAWLRKMATDSSVVCPVCFGSFKDPKLLPCCHTFCQSCLEKLSDDKDALVCPKCRSEYLVPPAGVAGFLPDFTVLQASQESEHVRQCQQCDSGDSVSSYCTNCQEYLCEFCTDVHRRQNRFKDHSLTTFIPSRSDRFKCTAHTEKLMAYCMTCHLMVCCECLVESHLTHDVKSANADSTHAEVREYLEELTSMCRSKLDDFQDKLQYINDVESSVLKEADMLRNKVESTYNVVLKQLNACRQEMNNKIENRMNSDLKHIWAEKSCLELRLKSIQTMLDLALRSEKCSNVERLMLSTQLISSMEALQSMSFVIDKIEQVQLTEYEFIEEAVMVKFGSITTTLHEPSRDFVPEVADKPSSIPLFSKASFSVKFLSTDSKSPLGYYVPNMNQDDVIIRYGGDTKKTLPNNRISISKTKLRGVLEISFTTLCGGVHDATLFPNSTQVNAVTFQFSVYGRPPYGSSVQRGPDWNTKRYLPSDSDGGAGKVGTVMNCYYPYSGSTKNTVLVVWNEGCTGQPCRWGHGGCYDIELV